MKAQQILSALRNGIDLYNEEKQLYVFLYNADNAICYYYLNIDEAKELAKKGPYWSERLGAGGHIIDSQMIQLAWAKDNEGEGWERTENLAKKWEEEKKERKNL